MSLSLERFQKLLAEDREERQKQQSQIKDNNKNKNINAVLANNIQTMWKAHGVLAPMTGCKVRPIPDHLYQCPMSAPQTTLVALSSLPQSVRSRLPQRPSSNKNKSSAEEVEDRIVEVPLAYLQIDESEAAADTTNTKGRQHQRQIHGNLSNKLSEYTRGVSGQCQPFLPGGGDVEKNATNDFLSETAVKNARDVLDKGSEASWKDQTMLLAPPGVDFTVGLSWDDVHGTPVEPMVADEDTKEEEGDRATTDINVSSVMYHLEDEPNNGVPPTTTSSRPTSGNVAVTPMWTAHDFLEDDSLFGSSSDDDDSDSDDEADAKTKKKGPLDDVSSSEDEEQEEEASAKAITADATSGISTDPDEVDELLLELSLSGSKEKKKKKPGIANNPLALAERQSQDQQDSDRKQWATTTLLPIDDINTWIPNPAMTFPFTLDGFQQQAIVRLERNESVFVAAHTSAGTCHQFLPKRWYICTCFFAGLTL